MSKEEKIENNEEINKEEEVVENQEESNTDTDSNSELSEIEKKEIELKEANDKFLRLYSEFDNFRRRTAKEKLEITKTAGEEIIKELLPILDDFERAIDNNSKSEDIDSIKEGFNLIHNKMTNMLNAKGLVKMDAKEEIFDVDKHEALTQIPAPSEDLKGKVVDIIEPGYSLHEKVIRFAKVVVGN